MRLVTENRKFPGLLSEFLSGWRTIRNDQRQRTRGDKRIRERRQPKQLQSTHMCNHDIHRVRIANSEGFIAENLNHFS